VQWSYANKKERGILQRYRIPENIKQIMKLKALQINRKTLVESHSNWLDEIEDRMQGLTTT
jgi:cytoplasmic iron level regulating protein YaaA (DUF328/UPF0246 family)